MREDGTDESPLHMNNRNMPNMKGGIPTEKLKKIRINRKDFKKGGDGLRGKNVTEQFRVKDKDMKRTMKWRTPEISLKTLNPGKPPDSNKKSKFERPRKPQNFDNESSDDILDMEEDEQEVLRKISERRSELNRARRNGDDCHVSWYPATTLSPDSKENEILLLNQDELVAVCNGKSSSIERARVKRSSRLWKKIWIWILRVLKNPVLWHKLYEWCPRCFTF